MPHPLRSIPNAGTKPHSGRRQYLDWMRGLAVVVMIEWHLLDSWTRDPDRSSQAFVWAMTVGGFGAPLFLFLAGVAVALSAESKLRRSGDRSAAGNQVMRRGVEIFALAFLFRLQAWILGWSPAWSLLKVDILNIMGPSIVAAAALWRATRAPLPALLAAMLAIVFATPIVRAWTPITALPDPIEAYIRPIPGLTNFVFLPWSGFVFAGAVLGLLIDRARTIEQEHRLNVLAGAAGLALAVASYLLSYLPSPYPSSSFWTTSPAFFHLRTGIVTLAVALAFFWQSRPGGRLRWSPFVQLGQTSLFIYWIHVEMVYGLISRPIHKSLSLPQAWVAFVLFTAFMLVCSIAKDRVVSRRHSSRPAIGQAPA